MSITVEDARAVIEATHAAWNRGDVSGMVLHYTDDFLFLSNTGPENSFDVLRGKDEFREYFEEISRVLYARTTIESVETQGDMARIRFSSLLRHKQTELEIRIAYRACAYFRELKIYQLEYYMDAAKLTAFWQMVAAALGPSRYQ
jgi:ketosteroid isomerase-like protein